MLLGAGGEGVVVQHVRVEAIDRHRGVLGTNENTRAGNDVALGREDLDDRVVASLEFAFDARFRVPEVGSGNQEDAAHECKQLDHDQELDEGETLLTLTIRMDLHVACLLAHLEQSSKV